MSESVQVNIGACPVCKKSIIARATVELAVKQQPKNLRVHSVTATASDGRWDGDLGVNFLVEPHVKAFHVKHICGQAEDLLEQE